MSTITLTTEQAAIIEFALSQFEEAYLDIAGEGQEDAEECRKRAAEATVLRHLFNNTFNLDVDL